MSRDLLAVLLSFGYVGLIVILGEGGYRLGLPREFARKVIHVGVGLWIWGTIILFESPYMAVIPPLVSAVGNWVIHRRRWLKSVEAEPSNLGTVYFPLSFSVLILLFWDQPWVVAGGVMAMTFGDAAASLVGQRFGRLKYQTIGGAVKSVEGSIAMFVVTFLAVFATLQYLTPWALELRSLLWEPGPGELLVSVFTFYPPADPSRMLYIQGAAMLVAVVAMCAEALGTKGRDNLLVPLLSGVVLSLSLPHEVGTGAALATTIGILAWRKGSLAPSGVLGAIITGTLVFGFGGWAGGVALVAFFVSSSLLSRRFKAKKRQAEEDYAKGSTRDLGQALANGGIAAGAALAAYVTGESWWLVAMVGALATANADTWATELGVLSGKPPRMVTTWREAPPGSSGAISGVGTLAALGGAAFIGLVAALLERSWSLWPFVPVVALAGLAGAMIDSLLGATVQAVYHCPACSRETERQVHTCGTATVRKRGWAWLGNDLVNFTSTLGGAAVAALLGFLLL